MLRGPARVKPELLLQRANRALPVAEQLEDANARGMTENPKQSRFRHEDRSGSLRHERSLTEDLHSSKISGIVNKRMNSSHGDVVLETGHATRMNREDVEDVALGTVILDEGQAYRVVGFEPSKAAISWLFLEDPQTGVFVEHDLSDGLSRLAL